MKALNKVSELQMALTIVGIVAYVVSNIVVFKTLQLPLGLTTTGAIFTIPITYILSDVFSECYGYRWSRITCYASFAASIAATLIFQLVIISPYPEYFAGQDAMAAVLGGTPRIVAASMLAYVLGDLANDRLFRFMKSKKDGMQGFKTRAIVSSLAGEVIDCMVFYPLALAGAVPASELVAIAAFQIACKVAYELVILPITEQVAKKVNKLEAAQ